MIVYNNYQPNINEVQASAKLIYNFLRGHCGLEVKATDCPFNNEVVICLTYTLSQKVYHPFNNEDKICLTYTSSQKVYHPFNNEVKICLTYTSSQKVYQVLDKQSIIY